MNATAVGYLRVSTQEQAVEGVSLAAQEERIKAYCALAGIELVETHREEGVSGGIPLSERPVGGKLVAAVEEKGIGHVVAMKLDRLFRDSIDALTLTREWDKRGVSLHLVDMGGQALSTGSAMGRFFLSMMVSFAELEKNLIGERTATAIAHKKARRQIYSTVPFGFLRDGDALKRNEAEQKVLRMIRTLKENKWSLNKIARHLNERGIPTKKGAKWYASTIKYILENTLYNHKSA